LITMTLNKSPHNDSRKLSWHFSWITQMTYGCKWDNTSHTRLLYDYFCDYFLGNILKIFVKFSWKNLWKNLYNLRFFLHTILIRFMLKIWPKMSFKFFQIHLGTITITHTIASVVRFIWCSMLLNW
jgi:hypothetical protein